MILETERSADIFRDDSDAELRLIERQRQIPRDEVRALTGDVDEQFVALLRCKHAARLHRRLGEALMPNCASEEIWRVGKHLFEIVVLLDSHDCRNVGFHAGMHWWRALRVRDRDDRVLLLIV